MNVPRGLRDEEKALLGSAEGFAALQVLLELLREAAVFIAGHGPCPPQLAQIPELKARLEFERANYRLEKKEAERGRAR